MISVLTLTYKRHHLLEEAIQSFLSQDDLDGCEMVIINDNPEVKYVYDHPKVRIINHDSRFSSISAKIEWGYKQCVNPYIYRLDDDDLLMPFALSQTKSDILISPDFDVYRSSGYYGFENNIYRGISNDTNNGNVYSKEYLDKVTFPHSSLGEDWYITFNQGGRIYTSGSPNHTMIYRRGMNVFHITGSLYSTIDGILERADQHLDNTKGTIVLNPHFDNDYYEQI